MMKFIFQFSNLWQNLFSISGSTLAIILMSAIGIYLSVIIFTRLSGKRSFSKMSSFDFAMTVAIGSMLSMTILSSSTNLMEGIIGLAAVYLLQILVALLRRFEKVKSWVDNEPLLLMDGTQILEDNLRKARVSLSDLRSKLREANITRLTQVKAVVFETTGDISVLYNNKDAEPLEAWLLKDVKK